MKKEGKAILILANSDSGLYDFRKELVLALAERGYCVHVSVPDTGYIEKIRGLGCVCHETVMERRGMNPAKDLKLFAFYRRLLGRIKPIAVFTYTVKPNIYGGMACRLGKIPYFPTVTGLGTALEGGGILQKLLVRMYREGTKKAACIFFQNRANLEFMKETGCVGPDASVRLVSGSGVNLEKYGCSPYPEDGRIVFLSVFRLMPYKGIEELLAAIPVICKEYPGVVFQLLGAYEEESRQRYEPRIRDLQAAGFLEYYGYRDDVADFMRNCHALVHPTYSEGMSNVLLEAAAVGRPLLASNISGCREIFEAGISGIAFTPKSVVALTEALRHFLSLPYAERKRMGEEARRHVEAGFDRKNVIKAYLEALEAAVSAGD